MEKKVYQVRAPVLKAAIEDDPDIHLVIAARGSKAKTMIVEFPLSTASGLGSRSARINCCT
ncbi:MAG: hypothetical protein ABJC60_01465, partial [Actinomycetota bacterium]